MAKQSVWNRSITILALRLVIGILTMMLAYHKIFVTGLGEELKWFVQLEKWFPSEFLMGVNIYAAVVELICGFLLCIGWKRDIAGFAILSVLVIVTFGHSLESEVWDIQQMVFRLSLLSAVLLLPADWDIFRIDRWRTLVGTLRGEVAVQGGQGRHGES